jgi:cytochrome d ubiquinol oxidase subunit I
MTIGNAHGLKTLEHQPAKIAAVEGHWESMPGESVPLILFGLPDMAAETTRYAIEVPYLGSLILTHSLHGQIPGLKQFAPEDRPDSTVVFWTFRVMVGLALLMLLLGLWSLWLRWRGSLFKSRVFLRFATLMGPAGLIALLAGSLTPEMGRQPSVVYGVMHRKDAVSNRSALAFSTMLIVFIATYSTVFGTGISYMLKLVARDPTKRKTATIVRMAGASRFPPRDRFRRHPTISIRRSDSPVRGRNSDLGIDLPVLWRSSSVSA